MNCDLLTKSCFPNYLVTRVRNRDYRVFTIQEGIPIFIADRIKILKNSERNPVSFVRNQGSNFKSYSLYVGRWDGRKEVYHFNGASETWTKQEDLLQSRTVSACTWFYSPKHDNRPVIYIGGGAGSSNTAEYLDYTVTETWEQRKIFLNICHTRPIACKSDPAELPKS